MSWRPDPPSPAHRLDRYAFRAGELHSPDGTDTGHVLVLPMVFWQRTGGHLWWRRWGRPRTTADVWIRTGPAGETHVFHRMVDDELLTEALDSWDAGRVLGEGSPYAVRWLGPRESADIAREVFGTDLDRSASSAPDQERARQGSNLRPSA